MAAHSSQIALPAEPSRWRDRAEMAGVSRGSRRRAPISGAPRTPRCRIVACEFPAQGETGFCAFCEAVYVAVHELRKRLLARRGARVLAQDAQLFDELDPALRHPLLDRIDAQPDPLDRGVDHMVGLEAFLNDLTELGIAPHESAYS